MALWWRHRCVAACLTAMTPSPLFSPPFTAYILCNQAAFIAATLTVTLAEENLPKLKQLARPALERSAFASSGFRKAVGSALWWHRIPQANSRGCLFLKHTSTNAEMQKKGNDWLIYIRSTERPGPPIALFPTLLKVLPLERPRFAF